MSETFVIGQPTFVPIVWQVSMCQVSMAVIVMEVVNVKRAWVSD